MKRFKVVPKGYCGCHPQTCNCNDYKIVNEDGKVFSIYTKENLVEIARALSIMAEQDHLMSL